MITPAQRLAALKALQHGVGEAIGRTEPEVRSAMNESGADRYRTPWGAVILATRQPTIRFDEDQLLAFAEEADLDGVEVIKQVRPTFRNLFKIEGDSVIFGPTGEVVEFATVQAGTSYLMTQLTAEAKEQVTGAIAEEFVGELTTGLDRQP